MKPESEAGFQRTVVEYAKLRRWWCYHDSDSRRNQAGLPDLILIRDGLIVMAELKAAKGRVRPAQAEVLALLGAVEELAHGAVRVRLWRPADWPEIQKELE